jgi:hypothetical protein
MGCVRSTSNKQTNKPGFHQDVSGTKCKFEGSRPVKTQKVHFFLDGSGPSKRENWVPDLAWPAQISQFWWTPVFFEGRKLVPSFGTNFSKPNFLGLMELSLSWSCLKPSYTWLAIASNTRHQKQSLQPLFEKSSHYSTTEGCHRPSPAYAALLNLLLQSLQSRNCCWIGHVYGAENIPSDIVYGWNLH